MCIFKKPVPHPDPSHSEFSRFGGGSPGAVMGVSSRPGWKTLNPVPVVLAGTIPGSRFSEVTFHPSNRGTARRKATEARESEVGLESGRARESQGHRR